MSFAASFLNIACIVSLGLLVAAFLLTIWRIVKGPMLSDRVLGLDLLVAIAISFIAVIGVYTGYYLYLDIALALGLVGFLATVAFARYIASAGYRENYLSKGMNSKQVENDSHG